MTSTSNTMTDAEATMRELGWVSAADIINGGESLREQAFKGVYEGAWDAFLQDLEEPTVFRYFNPFSRDYNGAASWQELAEREGATVFDSHWRIPPGLDSEAAAFCHALRNELAARGDLGTGGCHTFSDPATDPWRKEIEPGCVLVLHHDGGSFASYANPNYDCAENRRVFNDMLALYGLVTARINGAVTCVYHKDGPERIGRRIAKAHTFEEMLEHRHAWRLVWYEPWAAKGPEGNGLDARVELRATVHDCVNLARAAVPADHPYSGPDADLLGDFIAVYWASLEKGDAETRQ